MLWLLIAQAVFHGSGTPPPSGGGIFGRADYPAEAVRNGWEGQAIADLTVNELGAVTECRIVKSTGYQVLDAATCNLIITRAKFVPAKDENGRPRKDTFRTPTITWKLPN